MTQEYTRKSATEWEWQEGRKTHSVRYFPETGRLIWSGWLQTSEGPVFDNGVAQTDAAFLADGVAHIDKHKPPTALLDDLRALLIHAKDQPETKPKRWWRFFQRGNS